MAQNELTAMSKWPKQLPPISAEDQRINDDFMEYWHHVLPAKYSIADEFSHRYVARHAPARFVSTLEVGAGLGEHLKYERLTPEQSKNYVALETREGMAKTIKERYPEISVCVGDCQKRLAFDDNSFDRIIAINVLEHLPNLPLAIQEMHRLCKKSGVFSIVIPCEGSLAYGIARRISAKRIFEKRYRRPYDIFISREHLSVPSEIMSELEPFFTVTHTEFFPIPLKMEFCNLFIGANLKPK